MKKKNKGRKALSMLLAGAVALSGQVFYEKPGSSAATSPVSLKKDSLTLKIKQTKGKTVYGTGWVKVKKASGIIIKKITYKSKKKTIAAVSQKGKVTAKKAGSTKIMVTVRYKKNGKTEVKKLTCSVSVKKTVTRTVAQTTAAPQETKKPDTAEKTDNVTEDTASQAATKAILGDTQFDAYIPLLKGKRVALFSNHTGIVGDQTSIQSGEKQKNADLIQFGFDAEGKEISYGQHILDALIEKGVDVKAIFSPEHGFRGTADAGESVDDSVDQKTGVPILSLYHEDSHYPSTESMNTFDTLVVDMQDVGLRYYTYYISMYYLMDACAASGKEMIILDRPNPNGFYVDGPILQEAYKSQVGQLPIPVVYGMTWGELAQMINGEGWLNAGKNACKLTVIPCKNYSHSMKTSLIRKPSPNIRDMRAVYLYASTCFFENTCVSVGRGTDMPFEIYGSPYLSKEDYSFTFVPKSIEGAANPPFKEETCYGKNLQGIPIEEIQRDGINLNYLIDAYRDFAKNHPDMDFFGTPNKNGYYWIDLLSGSDDLRKQILAGKSAEEIKQSWQEDIKKFKEQRKPYLLYE